MHEMAEPSSPQPLLHCSAAASSLPASPFSAYAAARSPFHDSYMRKHAPVRDVLRSMEMVTIRRPTMKQLAGRMTPTV